MSPEQVEGLRVDHRTDIFSLGVLLYEMVTGERPFSGASQPALMSSILKDVPCSVLDIRDDLPRHLGRVISRCLEKDRRNRYQTARDVFNELKALRIETSATGATAGASSGFESAAPSRVRPPTGAGESASTRRDEGFWIAVLPFQCRAGDQSVEALVEGLTEDIITGMSRFSYLRVISRSSTSRYAEAAHDVREVGQKLGARYVMEGSVRQAGPALRVSVQLVDAGSGAHLWAETYNRSFSPGTIFELQDDLAPRIVSTVADMNGVLPHTMSEALRGRDPEQLTPYEALLLSFGYYERLTEEDHAVARAALERAVADAPDHADCWALLSMLYAEEHKHGFNVRPDPLGRALEAARRAVAAAPSNNISYHVLAQALFFRRELQAFRNAADRAVELNPMDGCTTAFMGILMAYAGDWDHGCALAERAMQLNPQHPGWYRFSICLNRYRKRDYEGALDVALKINLPTYFFTHATLAGIYGQLGEKEEAGKALRELLAQKPDFAETAREDWGKWFGQGELLEQLVEGLAKAGLKVESGGVADPAEADRAAVESGRPAPKQPSRSPSAVSAFEERTVAKPQEIAAETKSIVVLPFANLSPDPDAEYFSDGLTDEIITDLSRVRALRVISRSSAMRLKGDERGLAAIGRDLDCRYVLEGSVRRAAGTLRITARLVDAQNDTQLWADKYSGTLDDVFDIQERVSRSIVDALEIQLSPREAAQLAERPIDDARAQESYLRARSEVWSFMPGGLDLAISHLEAALDLIGDNALIYQGLGEAYFQYVNIGAAIGREEELIRNAEECVDKIFALEPDSPRGHLVRAQTRMVRGDMHGCARSLRRVLDVFPNEIVALQLSTHLLGWLGGKPEAAAPLAARLVDLDPLNPMSLLVTAMVPVFAGRFEEGVQRARRMFELDPVTPVWRANYAMALAYNRNVDEAEALTEGVSAQPDSDVGTWWMGLCRAAWRGDRAEVLRLADGPYRQAASWDAEIPWALASAHAAVGATEEALFWLDRAIDQGMINYPFLSEHDHYLESIRGDERFGRAMERARKEWERLDV
ncbi:MAG: protein kinase [Acidobacteriota bacterium]